MVLVVCLVLHYVCVFSVCLCWVVGSVVCLFWVLIVCVRFIVGFVCLVVLVIVAWRDCGWVTLY